MSSEFFARTYKLQDLESQEASAFPSGNARHFLGEQDGRNSITEGLGPGGVLVADPWLGGDPGEGRSLIGVHNGLPAFAAAIRARHIAIRAEYYEGCYLAEMFTEWGRISSPFPLRV